MNLFRGGGRGGSHQPEKILIQTLDGGEDVSTHGPRTSNGGEFHLVMELMHCKGGGFNGKLGLSRGLHLWFMSGLAGVFIRPTDQKEAEGCRWKKKKRDVIS